MSTAARSPLLWGEAARASGMASLAPVLFVMASPAGDAQQPILGDVPLLWGIPSRASMPAPCVLTAASSPLLWGDVAVAAGGAAFRRPVLVEILTYLTLAEGVEMRRPRYRKSVKTTHRANTEGVEMWRHRCGKGQKHLG